MRQVVALACILGALGCDDDNGAADTAVAMDAAIGVHDLAGRDLAGSCSWACDPDLGTCRPCCHNHSDCPAGERCLAPGEPDACAGDLRPPDGGCPPGTMVAGPLCFTATNNSFPPEGPSQCVPIENQCATDLDCPIGEECALDYGTTIYRCGRSDHSCGNCPSPSFVCQSYWDWVYCARPYCSTNSDCMFGATCIASGCYEGVGRCVSP